MPSKQEKFAEFDTLKNCFSFFFNDLSKGFSKKGNWHRDYFKNDRPIVLELGCGKGEYTVGLATEHPDKNYIGVDVKSNRIWTGAKQALEKDLGNTGFLKTRIDFIDYCFGENEVD